MSESAPQIADRPISVAEIRSFISAKRIAGCAVCSHYDWKIRDDTTALACGCGTGTASDIGIIMLVCQNCGALEFHDRGVITRWLDCHSGAARVR